MKHKIAKIVGVLGIALVVLAIIVAGGIYWIFHSISQSHVEGNVPDSGVFSEYLTRDLVKYFRTELKREDLVVTYELLRTGPTQSGIAYPKYYVWVKVTDVNNKLVTEGAVRLAAQEKTDFRVTDYFSSVEIKRSEEMLNQAFPEDVVAKIKER